MGKDGMVDAILSGYLDAAVLKECRDIYDDKILRSYVEASLLSTEDFDDISSTLELDSHTLMVYHDIYYDVHSISRVQKIKLLSKIDDSEELGLKQWSLTNGMEFVKWRLGLTTQMNALDSLQRLQADAYFRSKEAFFNGNSTKASEEGLKWSRLASSLVKQMVDMDIDSVDDVADSINLELQRITENNIDMPSLADLDNGDTE